MERLSSRVIIRLFWFWTTYFFAPRQRMCGRFPVVSEGAGCDAGSIPAGAALHQRAGRQASGSRPILPGSSAKDIPSHWPSSARANGEESPSSARGSSPERKARQGHDTKRSDWRDPDRLKPGRWHRNNPTTTRSPTTPSDSVVPTNVFKELCFSQDALGQAASTMHQSDIRGLVRRRRTRADRNILRRERCVLRA